MRLKQDAVNLLEIDRSNLVTNGLEQGAEAEVARAPQEALPGADDEGQGLGCEGVARETKVRTDHRQMGCQVGFMVGWEGWGRRLPRGGVVARVFGR